MVRLLGVLQSSSSKIVALVSLVPQLISRPLTSSPKLKQSRVVEGKIGPLATLFILFQYDTY